MTVKTLTGAGVPFKLVIEPVEYDQYAAVVDPSIILTLPFSNLGQGSIPARNWVWEHALQSGAARHWILDDNIRELYRLDHNYVNGVRSGAPFAAIEDFVNRYENIALAGMQYLAFVRQTNNCPPFRLNTRIYSCILIDNAIPYRWRGRYNEDTDLSLRALKDGWVTVLFNAFIIDKRPTMTIKGGNTDELYQGDGRLQMALSLQRQHPDVVQVKRRWGRWQHVVDYRPFKHNKPILKPGITIPQGVNNYGMVLKHLEPASA